MKNTSVAGKGVIAKKCAICALAERTLGGRARSGEGVYTPMEMERVRKRLKGKKMQASIVRKNPEAIGSKGVE
jgi:hypothetical protein